jgi:hypothetical protein
MSRTGRNFVVAYILLVGLPLLGLAAVLRVGRSISPPISIDGNWRIEADASRLSTQPCGKTLSSFANGSLGISQSGKTLVLTFDNASRTSAMGSLDGNVIKVSSVPLRDSAGDPACGGNQSPTLTATVDAKTEPKSLTGTLSVSGCASCAPVTFRAVRQPKAAAVGGGH